MEIVCRRCRGHGDKGRNPLCLSFEIHTEALQDNAPHTGLKGCQCQEHVFRSNERLMIQVRLLDGRRQDVEGTIREAGEGALEQTQH